MKNLQNDLSFFSPKLLAALRACKEWIWEIRLRINAPVWVETSNGKRVLTPVGLSVGEECALIATKEDVEHVLFAVSGQALYRISNALKSGVVFTESGVRIGVCGKTVIENGKILSITDITSLCIRFPCFYQGNAQKFLPYLFQGRAPLSTLIISPPAGGKTTLLRDFALFFEKNHYNAVVIDERLELSCGKTLHGVDILKNCPKIQGFSIALRSLSPEVVLCDELVSEEEVKAAIQLVRGGTALFATTHSNSFTSVTARFPSAAEVFERVIVLTKEEKHSAQIFTKEGKRIGEIAL